MHVLHLDCYSNSERVCLYLHVVNFLFFSKWYGCVVHLWLHKWLGQAQEMGFEGVREKPGTSTCSSEMEIKVWKLVESWLFTGFSMFLVLKGCPHTFTLIFKVLTKFIWILTFFPLICICLWTGSSGSAEQCFPSNLQHGIELAESGRSKSWDYARKIFSSVSELRICTWHDWQ